MLALGGAREALLTAMSVNAAWRNHHRNHDDHNDNDDKSEHDHHRTPHFAERRDCRARYDNGKHCSFHWHCAGERGHHHCACCARHNRAADASHDQHGAAIERGHVESVE